MMITPVDQWSYQWYDHISVILSLISDMITYQWYDQWSYQWCDHILGDMLTMVRAIWNTLQDNGHSLYNDQDHNDHFLSQCSMIVTRRAYASHTMLSRFSFRRKVRFAPADPLLRVEVEILCGKTLTGSSMMWRGECSISSSFISQPDECARRPSREVDLIWKFESYHQIINKYQKRMPRPRNRPWLLFIFGEQCKIDNAAAIQEW